MIEVGEIYCHYKNRKEYMVLDVDVLNTETNELGVYYKALYGEGKRFWRPQYMWEEKIEFEEKIIERFIKVGY
jgi:hypothetical protein